MNLVNIHNKGRLVYLFCRNTEGELTIKEDNSFFPYYYEQCEEGKCISFDNVRLKKLFVSDPKDISKQRGKNAYEADIIFTRRYLIDKVSQITETPIKYAFIDIEVLTTEFPDVSKAKFPVSCISIYNSFQKKVKTFFLPDYKTEYEMLEDFMAYMKEEKFDLWLSWNVKFDYNYLYNRIPDFDKKVSPINQRRYGDGEVTYPAGISIVDYLQWFKKLTLNKERSYALDAVAQKHFKEPSWGKTDFSVISEDIKAKNINDVLRMQKLEDKFGLIPYFNEVRRLSKVEWEDMVWNSRIIDQLLLEEAKNQKIVLPMKPKNNELETYEGAYREAYKLGALFDIGKYDLSSAYPLMVVDFCLDPSNILNYEKQEDKVVINYTNENQGKNAVLVDGTMFVQNQKALLPTVCKRLIELKGQIKKELSEIPVGSPKYKPMKAKYNAIKTVVNSSYGVMGNRFFRLYDPRVASATTFLVRDLLHYVKEGIELQGHEVVYVDTDSVFIESKEVLTDKLNTLIYDWSIRQYDKEETSAKFNYEGIFEKVLILAKCRYYGYVRNEKGELEEEIKGVEAKRKDSTVYMQKFQKILIDKILNKEHKEHIFKWIKEEVKNLSTQPLQNLSFPCKLAKQAEDYKNIPIFLRAVRETEGFNPKIGDGFFYIYVEPEYYHEEKTVTEYYRKIPGKREGTMKKEVLNMKKLTEMQISGKNIEKMLETGEIKQINKIQKTKKARDVRAFDAESDISTFKVDWKKMIDRNIYMKLVTIFDAMKWSMENCK